MKTENLLNAKQVSQTLRVALSTVYLWAETGVLPVVRGRNGTQRSSWRFRERDVEAWLRERILKADDIQ